MLLHVRVEDLEAPAWFGAVNKVVVKIFVQTSFIHPYLRGIIPASYKITLRSSSLVYVIRIGCQSKKSAKAVVENDMIAVTESSNQVQKRVARQVVAPKSLSFVLFVS